MKITIAIYIYSISLSVIKGAVSGVNKSKLVERT